MFNIGSATTWALAPQFELAKEYAVFGSLFRPTEPSKLSKHYS